MEDSPRDFLQTELPRIRTAAVLAYVSVLGDQGLCASRRNVR